MNKLKGLNDVIKSKIADHSKPLSDAVKEKNLVAKSITRSDIAFLNSLSSASE